MSMEAEYSVGISKRAMCPQQGCTDRGGLVLRADHYSDIGKQRHCQDAGEVQVKEKTVEVHFLLSAHLNSPSCLSRTFFLAYPKCYLFSMKINTPFPWLLSVLKKINSAFIREFRFTDYLQKGCNAFHLKMQVYITIPSFWITTTCSCFLEGKMFLVTFCFELIYHEIPNKWH